MSKIEPGPCFAESEESRKCLEKNRGVKSKCTPQFEAYKACKAVIYERKKKDRAENFKKPLWK